MLGGVVMTDKEKLFNCGVLTDERPGAVLPPQALWEGKKNGLVIIECPQRIPCNPCHTSCPTGAVLPFEDINNTPRIDYSKCTGCAMCVAKCPGLACLVVDLTYGGPDEALMKLPYEMLPVPEKGEEVACMNRTGEAICRGKVVNVTEPWKDRTLVVHVVVPRDKVQDVRTIKVDRAAKKEEDMVICRCEEVTLGEIREWIHKGYDTFDELKRVLRVVMGPCQGRGCREIILREVAKITGKPYALIPQGTIRPPVKPIKIGSLAKGGNE